jgi:hypothetical protein
MQLPNLFRPPALFVRPLYLWPRSLKRALLIVSVLAVVAAYLLMGGGIIAFLAVLAEWIGR